MRCLKKINKTNSGFAMEYKYSQKHGEITLELKRVADLKDKAVVFHACCSIPEVEGMEDRVRAELKVPNNVYHPLLG